MLNLGEGSKTGVANRACLNADAVWKERDEWGFAGVVETGQGQHPAKMPHSRSAEESSKKEDTTPIQIELLD